MDEYEKIKDDIENWSGGTGREYKLLTIIDGLREEMDELREAAEQILPKFEGWESMPDDKWLTVDRGDLRKLAGIIGREK